MSDRKLTNRLLCLIAVLGLAACGDDGAAPVVDVPTPGSVVVNGSIAATGVVGTPLAGAPSVLLLDTKGRPLAGFPVTFEVTGGGGSVASPTVTTDAAGGASAGAWTLGIRPGRNTLRAGVAGLPPVTFEAVAAVGEATSLLPDSANPAEAVVGQALEPAPAVRVRDRFGNPVPGVMVTFVAGASSGTLSGVLSVPSDSAGLARPGRWTLGTAAGTQTLAATAGALDATVSLAARAGTATSVEVHAGAAQTAPVASAVPVPPAVRVRDAWGNPVVGTAVTFAVTAGGGTVAGAAATVGPDGVAAVAGWTLGTVAGPNSLTATVAGVAAIAITATATAGPVSRLEKLAGDDQSVTAGSTLPVPPTVRARDAYDNHVPGAVVSFTPAAGTVSGATATADDTGLARVGAWTLAPTPGPQSLEVRAGAAVVSFTATALPGVPAVVQVAAGSGQSAPAGTAVAARPTVRVLDAAGVALRGVPVQFAVSGGGGSVSGAAAVTGADGTAAVGSWTLGKVAGPNTLTGTVAGVGNVAFTATATTGPAARVEKAAGDGQAAAAGTAVAVRPTVRVTDAYGNAVSGAAVSFAVSAGGGSVTGAAATTGSTGLASVGSWTLGTAIGTNTLTATAPGVGNVTFTAAGMDPAPSSSFHIDIRYVAPVSTAYQQVFAAAVARWQNVIIGDLSAEYVDLPANSCGNSPVINELVDDLLIYVELVPIDGVGQVLGSAGPCYVRSEGLLPVLGTMRFDIADLDRLMLDGSLPDVIQHELGHVLGIGTLWSFFSLLQGAGSSDPYFSGALGMSRFTLAGGVIPAGRGVPVENTGNAGTRDSHWRETTLQNELMTGWLVSAGNPLSAVTIGSLDDMGYEVNMFAADPFTLTSAAAMPNLVDRGVEIIEGKRPIVRVLPRD